MSSGERIAGCARWHGLLEMAGFHPLTAGRFCPLADTLRIAAFIFDQGTASNADFMDHVVTVDEVETRSGLDLLWQLPDAQENQLESVTQDTWIDEHFN